MSSPRFLNPIALWPYLSVASKLFLLILAGVSVRIVYRLAQILVRLRHGTRRATSIAPTARDELRTVESQLTSARQLQFFVSYLFAFYFFLQIPDVFRMLGDGKFSLLGAIIQNLGVHFSYATDVCFVLLILHTLQWIVSGRVSAALRDLS
jgi:hypothetical protein